MPVLNDAAETAIKEALKTAALEKTTKLSSDGVKKGEAYLTDKGVVYIKQNITPQTFFVRHRLSYQFRLLEENYADAEARELWSQLLRKLPQFFEGADIKPSLLHGNLQRDNIAETNTHPVTFHPASFFGHQDFDLVTSQMYGGLGQAFYNAYYDIIPRATGSRKRNQIYKLFHLLNKWNQSGEEHKKKAISLMKFLLKGP
ncbi:fructosamine-3-kinase-like isoform X3 [Schistocerca piceifrons]|uniref:fructosamine-3-kinase-like isoform X3 n=1 Tax=Schistocerca piceifrons TaxID=274613 RepID=UPI001F5E8617|nr:fructosamine-3-kinase-like isoform X3 [Schistocerca piceifrons]